MMAFHQRARHHHIKQDRLHFSVARLVKLAMASQWNSFSQLYLWKVLRPNAEEHIEHTAAVLMKADGAAVACMKVGDMCHAGE